ncbi:hypothetical protein D9M68_751660 [compost metagenome]
MVERVDGRARPVGGGDVGETVLLRVLKDPVKRRVHVHRNDVGVAVGNAGEHGVPGTDLVIDAVRHAGATTPGVQLGDEQAAVLVGGARLDQAVHAGLVTGGGAHQAVGAARAPDVVVPQVDHRQIAVDDGIAAVERLVDLLVEGPQFARLRPGATDGVDARPGHRAARLQLLAPIDGADGAGEIRVRVAVAEHPHGVDLDAGQAAAAVGAEGVGHAWGGRARTGAASQDQAGADHGQ